MKNRHRWFLGAGMASAIAASLCCVVPAVAMGLGLGSLAVGPWFVAWRPVFLLITFGFLAVGWFFAMRTRRASRAGETCVPRQRGGIAQLFALMLATLIAVGFAMFPWTVSRFTGRNGSPPPAAVEFAHSATLHFRIPSMDCEACANGIAATLRRERGTLAASVDFTSKTAVVRYDPEVTTPDRIAAAIDATGFPAIAMHESQPAP